VILNQGGAQPDQPLDLFLAGAIDRLEIQMEAVLHGARLGHRNEQHRRPTGTAWKGRRDEHFWVVVAEYVPAERFSPERGQALGVGAIDGDVAHHSCHGPGR
jgi:hypothetical protein